MDFSIDVIVMVLYKVFCAVCIFIIQPLALLVGFACKRMGT